MTVSILYLKASIGEEHAQTPFPPSFSIILLYTHTHIHTHTQYTHTCVHRNTHTHTHTHTHCLTSTYIKGPISCQWSKWRTVPRTTNYSISYTFGKFHLLHLAPPTIMISRQKWLTSLSFSFFLSVFVFHLFVSPSLSVSPFTSFPPSLSLTLILSLCLALSLSLPPSLPHFLSLFLSLSISLILSLSIYLSLLLFLSLSLSLILSPCLSMRAVPPW